MFVLLFIASCEEEELPQVQPLQEVFELIAPTASNINLNFALPDNPAFTIAWNDDITGGGSYTVEADVDSEFPSPMTLGTTAEKTFTMNVADFNTVVIGAGAEAFEPFMIYMRVSNGSMATTPVSFSVSPYTETPPAIASQNQELK